MRRAVLLLALAACGDNALPDVLTPEQATSGVRDGTKITVVGEVHAVTFDSTQAAMRRAELAGHVFVRDWFLEDDAEELRAEHFAYDDAGAKYPRTTDRYILLRSKVPDGITFGQPGFTPGDLALAWGLGVHLPDIDASTPLPEVGAKLRVTGTFHRITWNQREITLPILDDATIEVVAAPPPLAGTGAACTLDLDCNERLICQRATHTCATPPREIYWADPWHDVNGACDTDDDCPLGQVCDPSYAMTAMSTYYFPSQDVGRHLCRLAPGATVASQCPHIYAARDIVGGRFVTGKEICVDVTSLLSIQASDGDTHAQQRVDEPIPYPTADAPYYQFGATTENGPPYKDASLPGGPIRDPMVGEEWIAIGTYRYDPDHGWYEVHPVKAYLAPAAN